MLVRASSFTVELGGNGYLIGFTDDSEYPAEMPFGWRRDPATDANAVVPTTTDTGPFQTTIQVHDAPPAPETAGGWKPAEEISLRADLVEDSPGAEPTCLLTVSPQGRSGDGSRKLLLAGPLRPGELRATTVSEGVCL
jgi:hypothetical protein